MDRFIQVITVLLFAVSFFSYFYIEKYGMDYCESFSINDRGSAKHSLLIASQQSDYKENITDGIIDGLLNEEKDIYIELIDISLLPKIKRNEYDAYVILHTWEMYKPPSEVTQFIEETSSDKVFVVGTSGSGDLSIEGVDGISSASVLEFAPSDVDEVLQWLGNVYN